MRQSVRMEVVGTVASDGSERGNSPREQKELGDKVGKDVHFISISVDPLTDTLVWFGEKEPDRRVDKQCDGRENCGHFRDG